MGVAWEDAEDRADCRQRNDGAHDDEPVIGRRPVAGSIPKDRRNVAVLNPAAGLTDDPGSLVPRRLDLPGIALQLDREGPAPVAGQAAFPERTVVEQHRGSRGEI